MEHFRRVTQGDDKNDDPRQHARNRVTHPGNHGRPLVVVGNHFHRRQYVERSLE